MQKDLLFTVLVFHSVVEVKHLFDLEPIYASFGC